MFTWQKSLSLQAQDATSQVTLKELLQGVMNKVSLHKSFTTKGR